MVTADDKICIWCRVLFQDILVHTVMVKACFAAFCAPGRAVRRDRRADVDAAWSPVFAVHVVTGGLKAGGTSFSVQTARYARGAGKPAMSHFERGQLHTYFVRQKYSYRNCILPCHPSPWNIHLSFSGDEK